ncbi:Transcriptional regulator, AbiEi antitoxin, Type IV TA system [Micromonospora mirobrigensis]|uniref:Transcriptional regulator, AbiEi antitoxin, Type IV TA system n=1 Tax=Micromonospora mirobrigensis TaxID=262898 RepID=A0A1C4VNZ7_9ACTN|nr:Transcriptional regulator, AbiEi antitoxin, Type IV TA system [Micromonospora mirobrigensis]
MARGCFVPVPGWDVASLRRARIRAAVASLGPDAVAVLGTAAELHGIGGLPRTAAVHVSLPGRRSRPLRRTDPNLVVHQFVLQPSHIGTLAGVPATTPVRTVADLLLRVGRYPAVCLVDSALNRRLFTEPDLGAVAALLARRRGAVSARKWLVEADGRAQSPLETRARLRCVDGGVPPDVLQVEVRDADGYLLGVGDLGWRARRLIAEADGRAAHGSARALFEDRRRQNRLVNASWTILRFTWSDTLHPDYIPHVVRQALQASTRNRS